jgi:CxxC-x17-CxxC domain-containing protein
MNFQEKSLLCSSCGTSFAFTVQEQDRSATLSSTSGPRLCSWCRAARKIQLNDESGASPNYSVNRQRQFFPATCAHCGRHTQVPFQPRQSKPVYCSDCYNKVKVSR